MRIHNPALTRRQVLKAASSGAAAAAAAPWLRAASEPAILGGQPVRTAPFPRWPNFRERDEQALLPVLRSGVWSRAKVVEEAERRFARLMGAKYCLATCNGTNAIFTAIRALGIGAGDEVITTPYTFVASVLPILLADALPVFVDIDPQTWQMDPAKIEAKITRNTVAILPVHILGGICDMDRIGAIAKKHNLRIIEDACEAHGGEWRGRKVGTLGDLGCFSFQTGKTLTCGEGGAILGDDERLMDRCRSFHNMGRPYGSLASTSGEGHLIVSTKCRMAEYQASILITQMETFDAECQRRSENAAYLTERLQQIPGIVPRTDYPEVTRTAFYYYGFRYKHEEFDGLPRAKFIAALAAEGVRASRTLGVIEGKPINKEGCIRDALRSKAYQRIYPKEKLANYAADNECPECDRLVPETVGFHQSMLLGSRDDMDDIVRAIAKIYENRRKLVSRL
ncbi:MAG: DegT/DnrJ/EryC1/StrS family aminotransferase [Bryobacterales bacterium]|nr:DegT/DnrJ/EryC1/StrS family aminotransferase [Bryobacteraceae bacterium]MDW8355993.1 DegT/DnrJ/EryC1/StrS family aminotransferase [Bryobacterales bacterium]